MANPQQRVRAKRQCNTRRDQTGPRHCPLDYRDVCVFTNHPANLIEERRRVQPPSSLQPNDERPDNLECRRLLSCRSLVEIGVRSVAFGVRHPSVAEDRFLTRGQGKQKQRHGCSEVRWRTGTTCLQSEIG